jgi:quercetin dioxygenase-like cupin family protein
MIHGKNKADERQALFGGHGTVKVWDLLGSRKAPPFSAVLHCELEASGSVGAHQQLHDPEIIVGIAGQGQALVNGEAQALSAHAVIHLPLGSVLAIENLSATEPLVYLIIKASERA